MSQTKATNVRQFEHEACSRCGGSGEYSYCQMHGRTCFRCNGKRTVLTRRGAAAREYLRSLRQRKASEIHVGDVVQVFTGLLGQTYVWAAVVAISHDIQKGGSLVNGVMVPREWPVIVIETASGTRNAYPDEPIDLLLSKEERDRTLQEALDYQETLKR